MKTSKEISKPDITDAKKIIEVMEKLTDEEVKMMLMLIEGYAAGIKVAS